MNNKILWVGAVAACLFIMGCETETPNPPTTAVTGKVTYKGEPVDGASIQFLSGTKELKVANAKTGADGTFAMATFVAGDGAMPGKYKVTVRKVVSVEQGVQTDGENVGQPAYVNKDMLPKKYGTANSTPLEIEVTAEGEQTYDIELTD